MTQNTVSAPEVALPTKIISPRARIRPVPAEPAKAAPTVKPRRSRSIAFNKADLVRAVSAVAKAGFVAGSVEVTKDGTIRIYAAGSEPTGNLFDQWADKL